MANEKVSNPNDFKVVVFKNPHDFTFTPEMGCMYDGRPIFGITGAKGIGAGESITLPYHVGHRLAINLAKMHLLKTAPVADTPNIPTGIALWDSAGLERMKISYLTEMYTEDKPVAMNETDRLMAKVEELNRTVMDLLKNKTTAPAGETVEAPEAPKAPEATADTTAPSDATGSTASTPKTLTYQDKQEVIAELNKRGITHDKRKSKDDLEKLLA